MKKTGVSLIALVATIVIISILISSITISGIATINNANKMAFATEISLMQESVDSYLSRSNGQFPVGDSVQLDISGVTVSSKSQFDGEVITDDKIILSVIDYKLLGLTSLKYGLKDEGPADIYAVSRDTKRVYYAKGFAVGNKTYYTLTEDLKAIINYQTPETSSATQHGIIFVPTEIDWTNDDVNVQVKIPKSYISKTVTANGIPISLTTSDQVYDIYDVTGISGNYEIIANYAIDDASPITNSKFSVNNIDNVVPVISLDKDNQKLLKSDNPDETYAYFEILEKSDSLSGVKVVKYENERILDTEIASYFSSNGKTVYKDIITIASGVRDITVYIEDNAGNWTADFVTVSDEVFTGLLQ